jgi:hypothetical protein
MLRTSGQERGPTPAGGEGVDRVVRRRMTTTAAPGDCSIFGVKISSCHNGNGIEGSE